MSRFDDSLSEMERHPRRPRRSDPLALDDGTAERLLRGSVAVDDAPRRYRRVVALLAAAAAPAHPSELSGERQAVVPVALHIAGVAPASPLRKPKSTLSRRLRLVGVSLVGTAVFLGGLGAAGALPGAAQGIASRVLGTVGVSVPDPGAHSGGKPDQRGHSDDAVDSSGAVDAPSAPGTGVTGAGAHTEPGGSVSGTAQDPSTTGLDRSAAVSSVASDGQSRAGEVTPPTGLPADPPVTAPVTIPHLGSSGTGGASGGNDRAGAGTPGAAGGGRAPAGSGDTP